MNPARASRLHRATRSSWTWGAVCLVVALPFYVAGDGMDLFPFVMSLLGGLLCGTAFATACARVQPARRGLIALIAGAVAGSLGLWCGLAWAPNTDQAGSGLQAVVLMLVIAGRPGLLAVWARVLAGITVHVLNRRRGKDRSGVS